jgi:5-methylcytosine-specific restriction endonuclease McrA
VRQDVVVLDVQLPEPGSAALRALPSETHRLVYGFLFARRSDPPTMNELRDHMRSVHGQDPNQIDRRLRELRRHFAVLAERYPDGKYRYVLAPRQGPVVEYAQGRVSGRLRAQVLAPQRCAQCGRRPLDDGIRLEPDHKVPRHWGGDDSLENLQPLCDECNHGKQAYYQTYDEYANQIRQAAMHPEPHRRIGELLKAFDGDWVPSSMLGVVASLQQYQEDWQKRMRELRLLGWQIDTKRLRNKKTGRTEVSYRATHWEPWPEGSTATEVRRLEKEQRKKSE